MSKGTDRRTVRVAPELWEAARAVADQNGETVSDIVRQSLERYTMTEYSIQFVNPAATDGPDRRRWLERRGTDAADAVARFERAFPTCVVVSVQPFACG